MAAGYTLTHLILAPKLFQTAIGLVDLDLRSMVRALTPALSLALSMAIAVYALEVVLASAGVDDRLRALVGVAAGGLIYAAGAFVVRPDGFDDLLSLVGIKRTVRSG